MHLPLAGKAPLDLQGLSREPVTGLYVHVPFCFHKCHYCDFYSIPSQTDERMRAFVDRLLAEAALWRASAVELRPRTIFFGGGTPSLLPLDAMRRLLEGLQSLFDLAQVDEWTIEVNPATAERDYCCMLRECGATRLSFGAQSFDRAELKMLERHHNPDDVARSVALARAAGFERINVDLIFGIPGQTMRSWLHSLETAISLGTPHISCYALTYEPNTPMAVKKRVGTIVAIDEAVELQMLQETRRRLAVKGMAPYEVSNFARPGEACRHNLLYWDGGSYLGFGPSAASHVHGVRWKNRGHIGEWERAIDDSTLPAAEVEQLTQPQRMGEHAMLRLRLTDGIDVADFAARWNDDPITRFADPITRYGRQGLLVASEKSIRLTEAGVAVADAIAAEFLTTAGR
ncbi:MAG TPA: radical SAM family heme chaperone HemW [Tepidisphaeraceae bacterium]|nr:radical SAM family heme chaperone HemW [Tepidisphaeraceae bacterium]